MKWFRVATVMLALSTLTGWVGQFQSPCSSHGTGLGPIHGGHSSDHQPGDTWSAGVGHECRHCPPSECSRAAPCGGIAGPPLYATVVQLTGLAAHRVDLMSRFDPQPFSSMQPPTPPPQPVS
jgi:hypothetical protein